MSSSTGSPSWTTDRLVRTSIEYCSPTAPANDGGRPDSGSGLTSSARVVSVARNNRFGTSPKKFGRPTGNATATDEGGTSSLPPGGIARGATNSSIVTRWYSSPLTVTLSTVNGT